jgi:4-amino-4-deoxy-L-arabinose transferase-like glycosyltransferase
VTGPVSGGYERGTGAPTRSTGTQGTVGAILIVLALGLALRLILAYLLPGAGFESDLGTFQAWAANLANDGLYGFYERDFFHDYPPGYMYVLWVVGTIGNAIGGIGDLIKVPPILADLALGYLTWSMIRELGGRDRLALLGAAVVVVNPILWFDSVIWGQVDSFGVVFLLLSLRALWRDQPEQAAIYAVIAGVIKPQLGLVLAPLVFVVVVRRALWPVSEAGGVDAEGRGRVPWGDRLRTWTTGNPARILTTGLAGYVTAFLLCQPFGLSVPFGLIEQVFIAAGGYEYITVNAYNLWAIVPGDLGNSLANAGLWVCDAPWVPAAECGAGYAAFGAVPAFVVGTVLLLVTSGLALWVAARRPEPMVLLVALAVLALAFYAAPTRVHERYGFPFFALGAILFAVSPRWRVGYVVLSIATFANMYVVLTTLYPPSDPSRNPVRDWLGMGEFMRSEVGVTVVAVLHTVAFGWALLQLRSGAGERLEEELTEARLDPDLVSGSGGPITGWRPPDAAGPRTALPPPDAPLGMSGAGTSLASPGPVAAATWTERRSFADSGLVGWIRDRLDERPVRADRSPALAGEGGGRLGRLDAWILVVLVLASLGMRTFRLEEPYQMHFDEVYHARTATEFLQAWRYGESHDIYEWTHPHLAKYAMAVGLVLWGRDEVNGTSQLGVPIRAAAVEPRREDALTGGRSGERVHLATGTEIRTMDLRTRELIGAVPAPGSSALVVDEASTELILGFDDGRIATLDLTLVGVDGLEPIALGSLDHPIDHLLVTEDGTTILAASGDRLTAIDSETADVRGTLDLAGIADLELAGTGSSLLATPSAVEEPAALASTLVELIGGDAADYEAQLAGAGGPDETVVLGSPGDAQTRTKVEEAITDGRLAGVEIVDLPRVAIATADGLTFVDPSSLEVSSTLEMDAGAHGMDLISGVDNPKLYVTTGTIDEPAYEVVVVGGDPAADGPDSVGRHPLPGLGSRVAYNAASQQVHVLGLAPGAESARDGPWTVYVIEPHANAVYADAELPGGAVYADAELPAGPEPVAWAMDIAPDYPATDRQQLLVFGAEGQTASIDVGSHAFAWRLPGVIAGVLMAACLYLLGRILFRRRLVAGLVAVFALVDGMLFVQSRIAMNDAYVGLFIVAAYTVFAAVWTGWWRWRGAFWVAMPLIGGLLGLALAAKWVAAYAIGALALLLLVRSALGRTVAILGLILITSVLGHLAIAIPAEGGLGNLPFLVLMIGLTLVAVVAAVFHPIAWTDEEMRFAVIAPAALGALVFFVGLALGRSDATVALGPVAVTPVLAAIALAMGSLVVYAVFRLAGAIGYGPLAGPEGRDDPDRVLEPPAPAPAAWLRPGAFLGLPLVWAAICMVAIPLAVYVVSYIPWALIENHRLWEGLPAGHTGQTLVELTGQMYGYHNSLSDAHAASSPWWAWPFDLKPVWFYQDSMAGGTSAAVYDAGNLVIWWLGVPALVFVAIMAFRRRSLALALIAIGFAAQWVSWARIDRAAFQYHYYTALPFVLLALAYLAAELWHGASRRTWLAVRLAGAAAVIAPAAMWLLSRPLCGFVGVQDVNPGSQACPALIPDLVITLRVAALLAVVAVGAYVLSRALGALGRDTDAAAGGVGRSLRTPVIGTVAVAIGFVVVALLADTPILTLRGIAVEPIALLVILPLLYLAGQIFAARDAHRFVVGIVVAAVGWFAVAYPNIAALPLPSTMVNAYQGLLPTYLYAFQFPVSKAPREVPDPFLSLNLAVLALGIGLTCLVVAYSASVWRLALAESRATDAASGTGSSPADGADGLARTGGGA